MNEKSIEQLVNVANQTIQMINEKDYLNASDVQEHSCFVHVCCADVAKRLNGTRCYVREKGFRINGTVEVITLAIGQESAFIVHCIRVSRDTEPDYEWGTWDGHEYDILLPCDANDIYLSKRLTLFRKIKKMIKASCNHNK